jgi:hypothetical protein
MRITCDRCGKDRMLAETHAPRSDLPIREIIKRIRVEPLTGIEGVSSRPVRKIVVLEGVAAPPQPRNSKSTPDSPRFAAVDAWAACGLRPR